MSNKTKRGTSPLFKKRKMSGGGDRGPFPSAGVPMDTSNISYIKEWKSVNPRRETEPQSAAAPDGTAGVLAAWPAYLTDGGLLSRREKEALVLQVLLCGQTSDEEIDALAVAAIRSGCRIGGNGRPENSASAPHAGCPCCRGIAPEKTPSPGSGKPLGGTFAMDIHVRIDSFLSECFSTCQCMKADPHLSRVLRMVESTDCGPPPTVPHMARVAGLSKTAFCNAFRRRTGLTPHQFIRRHRLMRVIRMVRAGERTMLRIALDTGFSDEKSMRRNVVEVFGITPSDLRRLFSES